MICFDTSFLVDYRHGEEYTATFLNDRAGPGTTFAVPTPVEYELLSGAAISQHESVADVRDSLDWAATVPFDRDSAVEAASIRATLRARGTPIGALDTAIAGTVRSRSATLVTSDTHFESVPELATVDPRER